MYIIDITESIVTPCYHAKFYSVNENDFELLSTKIFNRFTHTTWKASRILANVPIKCNNITSLCSSLLFPSSATPLKAEKGAFIDFNSHLDLVIFTYSKYDVFLLPTTDTKVWNFKLSWDNLRVWKKNETWTLSPLSILHNQQPQHTHLIMYAQIPECNFPMTRCVLESHLLDFLNDFNEKSFYYHGEEIFPNLFLDADWIGLVRYLNTLFPNTRVLLDRICTKCGVTKQHLQAGW